MIIQATAADIIKLAMIDVKNFMDLDQIFAI
jgi:DNA polymerase I-like protein with 3'-5' exonuclease and polymerase domains